MLSILIFSIFLISSINAINLPRQIEKIGSPVYIACVSDSKISSLIQNLPINATTKEECSSKCSLSFENDLSFFKQNTNECYCTFLNDSPTSDEIVYSIDEKGNCRLNDDTSVEYLKSLYKISTCILPPISISSSNFTSNNPVECLINCPNDTTQSIAIRPEYNDDSDKFQYECSCFDNNQITGGQQLDCGFGIETIYVRA
ncbi:uncharacterized protein I206_100352 [Kwoniella pini CBS 10737]|uniref:Apple domain-containing protein n=1 Tax=Kwoniella pini CBS 10737 TaxID=1296096 RepID=A0A1B9IDU0_9TREE|nr:uncharacterized protein I206_00973 [Kwoniella pini CBS 10737]OCF53667.1 hypothetical protein I206_00973 [Kwoniella pini CBS 10737]